MRKLPCAMRRMVLICWFGRLLLGGPFGRFVCLRRGVWGRWGWKPRLSRLSRGQRGQLVLVPADASNTCIRLWGLSSIPRPVRICCRVLGFGRSSRRSRSIGRRFGWGLSLWGRRCSRSGRRCVWWRGGGMLIGWGSWQLRGWMQWPWLPSVVHQLRPIASSLPCSHPSFSALQSPKRT